jgi:very-short-patch-repair endonuclease
LADFLCREHRLVVEIDGFSHDLRTTTMPPATVGCAAKGYQVARFNNAKFPGLELNEIVSTPCIS